MTRIRSKLDGWVYTIPEELRDTVNFGPGDFVTILPHEDGRPGFRMRKATPEEEAAALAKEAAEAEQVATISDDTNDDTQDELVLARGSALESEFDERGELESDERKLTLEDVYGMLPAKGLDAVEAVRIGRLLRAEERAAEDSALNNQQEPSATDLKRLMGSLPAIGIDSIETIELAKEYRAEEYAEEYKLDECASSYSCSLRSSRAKSRSARDVNV